MGEGLILFVCFTFVQIASQSDEVVLTKIIIIQSRFAQSRLVKVKPSQLVYLNICIK